MPTYEYKCDKCGRFELEQRITEDPIKKCPTCGGEVKRLISASGIMFKGSGFHINDYSSKGSGSSSAPPPSTPSKS